MSHIEEAMIRRFSGQGILLFGIAVVVAGVLPLLLYTWLGPKTAIRSASAFSRLRRCRPA